MKVIEGLILGALFGGALYYVGASNPKKLLSMLRLQDLKLMKIIFFGIGFGSTLLAAAALAGVFDISHLHVKTTHLGVIIGGIIFGLGFGSIGTCPGTCVTAASSGGKWKAVAAVVGGLAGAFAFSMVYGRLRDAGLFGVMNLGKLTWFNISDQYPAVFNLGYIGLLAVGICFMIIAAILPHQFLKD